LSNKNNPGSTNEIAKLLLERAVGLVRLIIRIKQATTRLEKGEEFNPGATLLSVWRMLEETAVPEDEKMIESNVISWRLVRASGVPQIQPGSIVNPRANISGSK